MSEYDGKIQLGMDVSPEDAIKSFKRLQSQAQKTFDALSTEKSTKEIQKLEAALSKSVSNGEKLNNKLDEVSKKQIPTEAYKDLSKDIEYAEKRLAQLTAQQERARKAESMKPVVAEYEQLQQKAEHYKTTIENLTKQQGEDSEQVKQLKVEYSSVLMNLDKMAP
ncbi:MAG: hypothetical protein J6O49_05480, partial [Bacteroidaceae bacterium]|nr:hypothetical protein [Bacteroidaceae bacterium]